jgi:hypothetical protein
MGEAHVVEITLRYLTTLWGNTPRGYSLKKRKTELPAASETTKKEEVKEKLQEIIKLTKGLSLEDQKDIWHWLAEQKPVAMFPSDEGTTLSYPQAIPLHLTMRFLTTHLASNLKRFGI